jgi:hypothetical protein
MFFNYLRGVFAREKSICIIDSRAALHFYVIWEYGLARAQIFRTFNWILEQVPYIFSYREFLYFDRGNFEF